LLATVFQGTEIGADFARALAAKDSARLLELMHPEIDFRGLTPNRSWEANGRDAVLSMLLGEWFEDSDEIEALEELEGDAFADRDRVGYRFSVTNPDPLPGRAAGVPVRPRRPDRVDARPLLGIS
jgi:hypothetical protein